MAARRIETLGDLIGDALERGCDVTIQLRRRPDGQKGACILPLSWVERMTNDINTDLMGVSVVAGPRGADLKTQD